ncbi:MAG: hypothetical protein KGJ09_09185 [Candidatus Omnitrophica bacterium]|nr:hypothetical protein [Candidatus Omnitrophota bacterium]
MAFWSNIWRKGDNLAVNSGQKLQPESSEEWPDGTSKEKVKTIFPMPVILPWLDPLQTADETAATRIAYRQMLRSPIVMAGFLKPILSASTLRFESHPYKADAGQDPSDRDKQIARFVRWMLMERLEGGLPEFAFNVLAHARMDGVSVNEKVWGIQEDGQYRNKEVLRQLKPKDVDQDLYLWTDAYRNVTAVQGLRYNAGEFWDPRSFIILQNLSFFGNPGGMSALRPIYVDFWQLDTVEKIRAMGAEKRAFPVIAATYPSSDKETKLQAALNTLRYSNWLAVPKDVQFHILNTAGSADEYFQSFRRDKIENIFIGLEFAFLQSITGGQHEYRGSAEVAKGVSSLMVFWLAQRLIKVFNSEENGLIKEIVDRNYRNVDGYPKATLTQVDLEAMTKMASLINTLQQCGFKVGIRWAEETFGIPFSRDASDILERLDPNPHMERGGPKDQGARGKESDPGKLADENRMSA